jgi:hypothetical protein
MIVVDTPRLPRGRRALSTVNEHTVLKNDLPNSAQSTSMAHSGYDLKRSLSSPLQTDHDYSGMNEEKRDDIIVNRSHELRRSSSLLVKSPSSDRHIDNHPKSKFENSDHHVPDARVSASFKSSKKINRQLSEALLPKTTIAYDETVPDTVMIRNRGRLCTLVKKEAMLLLDTYTDQSGSFSNLRNGLFIVFFLGTLIGLWMPKNTDLPTPWYRLISSMIGYTYVVSWSVSQCKRKIHLQPEPFRFIFSLLHSDMFLPTAYYKCSAEICCRIKYRLVNISTRKSVGLCHLLCELLFQ